jgi:hypothetical protein
MAIAGVNDIAARSVYPQMGGQTLGSRGSSSTTPVSATNGVAARTSTNKMATTPAEAAAAVGATGTATHWWLFLILALVGLMFLARHLGEASEFASIKMSVYNVVIISLAAIIGINFFKLVFTKFPVPGLSTLALAS